MGQARKKAKGGTKDTPAGGVKAGTINRDFRTIRAMLNKVLAGFRFPAACSSRKMKPVQVAQPEDEVLAFATVREEVRVGPKQGTRPVPFRDMTRLAALTLMRLTEIRTLRRSMWT